MNTPRTLVYWDIQEKILQIDIIEKWDNWSRVFSEKTKLVICEFSEHDIEWKNNNQILKYFTLSNHALVYEDNR